MNLANLVIFHPDAKNLFVLEDAGDETGGLGAEDGHREVRLDHDQVLLTGNQNLKVRGVQLAGGGHQLSTVASGCHHFQKL